MLFYRGKIEGIKKREYQGKTRAHLQFVAANEEGELTFLEIRIPDGMDVNRFKLGSDIEVPLQYSLVQGELYFKINDKDPTAIKVSAAK